MKSLIFSTATRFLVPVIFLLSVFVFLRGHNAPGGGFIGGLLAATALAVREKAEGIEAARRTLRFRPQSVAATGLGMALVAGVWGGITRDAFLKGIWPFLSIGADGEKHGLPVGSIFLFDLGVYFVVLGTVCGILFALEEAVSQDMGTEDIEP